MTSPSWGFSLAVSGSTSPLLVTSSFVLGFTTTRSPRGCSALAMRAHPPTDVSGKKFRLQCVRPRGPSRGLGRHPPLATPAHLSTLAVRVLTTEYVTGPGERAQDEQPPTRTASWGQAGSGDVDLAAGGEVLPEPLARQAGDLVERAGLLEQVGG